MSSVNFFCWLQQQYWWGFHCVSKGPHISSLDRLYFVRWWVARQTTYLQTSCVLIWSCSPYCSSPAASFAPEIPLGLTHSWSSSASCLWSQVVPVLVSSTVCCGRMMHRVPRPSWSYRLQLYTLSLQGESEPRQSHHFLNSNIYFPLFLLPDIFNSRNEERYRVS